MGQIFSAFDGTRVFARLSRSDASASSATVSVIAARRPLDIMGIVRLFGIFAHSVLLGPPYRVDME